MARSTGKHKSKRAEYVHSLDFQLSMFRIEEEEGRKMFKFSGQNHDPKPVTGRLADITVIPNIKAQPCSTLMKVPAQGGS
jgi:hypothetical protein